MSDIYTSGNDFVNDVKKGWNRRLKSTRIWGFIASVLMIIMGIVCLIKPIQTTYAIEVLVSIAFLCFGIWELVRYFREPPYIRTGVGLASSILNIILGIMLLTSPAPALMETFGFMLGLNLMMLGFDQVTSTGRLHMFGVMDTGWLTLDGVLNIICGLLLLFTPFASVFAVSMVFAFYLLAGGITLFIACVNVKHLKADES